MWAIGSNTPKHCIMKHLLKNTIVAVVALVGLMSCDPTQEDQHIIDTMESTDPAFVALAHTLKSVTLSAGALVTAQNLSEYIDAPEEDKRAVEDKYYKYYKVRNEEGDLWRVYSDGWEEKYRLTNGKTLSEDGAEWLVVKNDNFFGNSKVVEGERFGINTVEKDVFDLVVRGVTSRLGSFTPGDYQLNNYLKRSAQLNGCAVQHNADLTVTTNSSSFRAEDTPALLFSIEGRGEFIDATGAFYKVTYEITEPIYIEYNTSGFPCSNASGKLSISVQTSPSPASIDKIEVDMRVNKTIIIDYLRGGHNYNGVFTW